MRNHSLGCQEVLAAVAVTSCIHAPLHMQPAIVLCTYEAVFSTRPLVALARSITNKNDTVKFIQEIASRNAIWDITCDEYSDRVVKRTRWVKITNIMCKENFTEKEKIESNLLLFALRFLRDKW